MIKGNKLILSVAIVLILGTAIIFLVSKTGSAKKAASLKPSSAEKTEEKSVIAMAPNFSVFSTEGKKITLSDYRGKVVVLNFWATWCSPCVEEIPSMIEIQKEYGDKGFTFIGLAVSDSEENVKNFIDIKGVNYSIGMATKSIIEDYGNIRAIPTTIVISREGKVVNMFKGSASKEEFEKTINAVL